MRVLVLLIHSIWLPYHAWGEGLCILLSRPGGSAVSVELLRCAASCAGEESCVGVTVSGAVCERHQQHLYDGLQNYQDAQYKEKGVCLSLQQPPIPLEDSPDRDWTNHLMVVRAPFQHHSTIHTINYYAGATGTFQLVIADGVDSIPSAVNIRAIIDVTATVLGFNTMSLAGLPVSAGQYYGIYWGATSVIPRIRSAGTSAIAFQDNVVNLPAVGDEISLRYRQNREYRIELNYNVCFP